MGLTVQSTWLGALKKEIYADEFTADRIVLALAGNPNTGKSTVFNSLTGLNQHTGNWPGKTVTRAQELQSYGTKIFSGGLAGDIFFAFKFS